MVFTGRSIEELISERGSQEWVLNPERAPRCSYLVCTQNAEGNRGGRAGHGEAFMVGKVSTVEAAPEETPPGNPERYIIRISDFARISIPNAWDGSRNPCATCI